MSNKIKEGIETLKNKLTGGGDDIATKAKSEQNFIRSGAADFNDFVSAEGGRRAVVRQVMKNNANYFGLTPEVAESIAKFKDLGKGGSNFPDPLIVFRDKGLFTTDELTKIDEIIESNPFDDVKNIADKVSDYLQSIRPDGFAEGGRIGFKSGKSVKEMLNAEPPFDSSDYFGKAADYKKSPFAIPDNFLEKLMEYLKRDKKAEGGRIGFKSGKSVKDGIAALLKLGNKKFGKDTIKTADDIEPSEFSKFNERNKVLDDLDIEDYEGELGDPETWYTFGMTVREADELVKSRKAYEAQMFTDYKAGRLDPKPGESGRKKFLEKKAEEAEMSGDSRLFTPDEADELTMLEASSPANVESALGAKQYGGIKNAQVPMELMTVDIIKVKYPQIPDEMAEMIASLPNDKKALAIADLEQAIMLQGTGRSSDEIIEIMKREPKTKMKSGGLAQILEM